MTYAEWSAGTGDVSTIYFEIAYCPYAEPGREGGKGESTWGRAWSLHAETCNKQRGTPENLWPKFILKGAPLRATSSVAIRCTCHTTCKRLKTKMLDRSEQVGISPSLESFTRAT